MASAIMAGAADLTAKETAIVSPNATLVLSVTVGI